MLAGAMPTVEAPARTLSNDGISDTGVEKAGVEKAGKVVAKDGRAEPRAANTGMADPGTSSGRLSNRDTAPGTVKLELELAGRPVARGLEEVSVMADPF